MILNNLKYFLMIRKKKKKRNLALSCGKKISALLKRITSKHDSDFY